MTRLEKAREVLALGESHPEFAQRLWALVDELRSEQAPDATLSAYRFRALEKLDNTLRDLRWVRELVGKEFERDA